MNATAKRVVPEQSVRIVLTMDFRDAVVVASILGQTTGAHAGPCGGAYRAYCALVRDAQIADRSDVLSASGVVVKLADKWPDDLKYDGE